MERLSISEHVERARVAQKELATFDQARIDDIVCAVARVGYVNAEPLAKLAAEETGLGRYEDKVQKNRRKTLGTLRDLTGAQSMGVIRRDDDKGITEIAKPVGVVGAITPVTNPSATPINNIMVTLKGANAVLIAPHPKADRTCAELIRLVHHELERLGAPKDAVQHVSLRSEDKEASKARSQELMREVDIVLVTAGPANVARGIPERNTGPRRRPGQRIGDHRRRRLTLARHATASWQAPPSTMLRAVPRRTRSSSRTAFTTRS